MSMPPFPLIQKVPRQVLTKGRPGSRVTFFPSRKLGSPITCGNLVQAEFCVHLEYRREIRIYECRPSTLQSGHLRFKADFLVTQENGALEYLKFVPHHTPVDESESEWRRCVEDYLMDTGPRVKWLTPTDLPRQIVTSNLRYLYYYSFGSKQRSVRQLCTYVSGLDGQCTTVGALIASGACTQDICQAIFSDGLHANLEQELSSQTIVHGRSA